MTYEYECPEHGKVQAEQAMDDVHKLDCPVCSKPCDRIYGKHVFIMAGRAYRADGSTRDDRDYARLKG